jgi:outer membrane protein OmpA-like peptidoglycan-associated protein
VNWRLSVELGDTLVSRRPAAIALLAASVVFGASVFPAAAASRRAIGSSTVTSSLSGPKGGVNARAASATSYPFGTPDSAEPSGVSPPGADGLSGYQQSYVTDFSGTTLPSGWDSLNGVPGSDPGSRWASSHVVVSGGLLQLNTWQDPSFNNLWVSGGVCQCGLARTNGAYFVRSRLTGPGPTQVELLWPTSGWPPEVDFNETSGGRDGTVATLHFDAANDQVYRRLSIDMTQWHTWGVVWTPALITYTVDGNVWGTVSNTAQIPRVLMTLDITQQTWCSAGWACPTSSQSTLVDWVAEYSKSATISGTARPARVGSVTVGPFPVKTANISRTLMAQIVTLAAEIKRGGHTKVSIHGYGDGLGPPVWRHALARARALVVETRLEHILAALGVTNVTLKTVGLSKMSWRTAHASSSTLVNQGNVVVTIS